MKWTLGNPLYQEEESSDSHQRDRWLSVITFSSIQKNHVRRAEDSMQCINVIHRLRENHGHRYNRERMERAVCFRPITNKHCRYIICGYIKKNSSLLTRSHARIHSSITGLFFPLAGMLSVCLYCTEKTIIYVENRMHSVHMQRCSLIPLCTIREPTESC